MYVACARAGIEGLNRRTGVGMIRALMPGRELTMNTKPMLPGRIEPPRPVDEPRDAANGPGNRKIMVVGKGINLNGEIKSCDRLLIEGLVEGTLSDSMMLSISETAASRASPRPNAEIEGLFRGKMTVRPPGDPGDRPRPARSLRPGRDRARRRDLWHHRPPGRRQRQRRREQRQSAVERRFSIRKRPSAPDRLPS
jgi:hypothetical protein